MASVDCLREELEGDRVRVIGGGDWTIQAAWELDPAVRAFHVPSSPGGPVVIDLSAVENLDTTGAWIVHRYASRVEAQLGSYPHIVTGRDIHKTLIEAVQAADQKHLEDIPDPPTPPGILDIVRSSFHETSVDIRWGMSILGTAMASVFLGITGQKKLRIAAVVSQVEMTGWRAIPIIALMSFLVGGIVAQQGAYQLKYLGMEVMTVDLVGILICRELGVLLTAIMVAGRSGSAFTAEIGTMKMREEIDALKVTGMDPVDVLILPRIMGLVVAVPLLTVISCVAAVAGAVLVTNVYSGISVELFITRFREVVEVKDFIAGMMKAPFMAMIIAIISCSEGLRASGSAESVGRRTTSAVVKSIFMVIVVDGLFAVFFAAIEL